MAKKRTNRTAKAAKLNYAIPTRNTKVSFGASSSITNDLTKLCGITNPFCPAAFGAKLPDSASSRSYPITMRETFSFSSDASGYCNFYLRPEVLVPILDTGAQTSTTVTLGTNLLFADNAVYEPIIDKYRIVSTGCRIYSTLAPSNQSGMIRISSSNDSGATAVVIPYTSGLFEQTQTFATSETDIVWIGKPTSPEANDYHSFNERSLWTSALVTCTGLPPSVTDCIVCELILHVECLPAIHSVSAPLATKAADPNHHLMDARSHVHAHHGGKTHGKGVMATLWNGAKAALAHTVSTLVPYAGPALGAGLRSILGLRSPSGYNQIMDVD